MHLYEKKIQTYNFQTILLIISIISVAILPFFLIIIEKIFLPHPALVEEISKFFVIFFLILNLPTFKQKILAGLFFGFLFGLSENIFYLINIIDSNDITIFWKRILIVIPMHIITVIVMVLAGSFKKWFIIFGMIGAIIIHFTFNIFVVKILIQ